MTQRYTGQDPTFKAMQATIDARPAFVATVGRGDGGPARLRPLAAATGYTRKAHRTWYRINGRFVSEDTYHDTLRDMQHARDTWLHLEDEYEYDGPETIMMSTGYAVVFPDGDVVQYGRVLWNVAD